MFFLRAMYGGGSDMNGGHPPLMSASTRGLRRVPPLGTLYIAGAGSWGGWHVPGRRRTKAGLGAVEPIEALEHPLWGAGLANLSWLGAGGVTPLRQHLGLKPYAVSPCDRCAGPFSSA